MSAIPPSMSDRDGKIWMDGQMVDWRDAKIHVLSHTLHYGCGAFEGVRAYKTAQWHRNFPFGRTHRTILQQRQNFAHEHTVYPSASQRSAMRGDSRKQTRKRLPASADLDWR